jgi:uncharacterized repeat protein (TIGR03806 family)
VTWKKELALTRLQIVGFGADRDGELCIVDLGGQIHQLEPVPATTAKNTFPRTLGELGLFRSVPRYEVQPALVPYTVNAPLWSDGAHKERHVALPGVETIGFSDKGFWTFPEKTVLVKTFSLDLADGTRKRIETRLMTLQDKEWFGYSYAWNDEQTDAVLVDAAGKDRIYAIAGKANLVWHYPSRVECMVCHSRAANYVLGLSTRQINREVECVGGRENQLRTMARAGVFAQLLPKAVAELPRLADPDDEKADTTARVRAYMHSNCAQCHVWAGGGNAAIDLHADTAADKMKLIRERPLHDKFGIADAFLVAPGSPKKSVLLHRMTHRGRGQMPPLASARVDEKAVKLFEAWIEGMK